MQVILIFLFLIQVTIASEDCSVKNSFALVELFTSEGCSSCPPAEAILNKLSKSDKSKNIFPLAFHVDYWDYIGWKDIYSKKEYSDRQRQYADKFHSNSIYTPQVIINGKFDILGSDEKAIMKQVNLELQKESTINFNISMETKSDKSFLKYKIACAKNPLNLQILIVKKGLRTKVLKGENANKTLLHENVVLYHKTVPNVSKSGSEEILFTIGKSDELELIVFLQNDSTYEVMAAQSLPLR
jgi:hypothetical protein